MDFPPISNLITATFDQLDLNGNKGKNAAPPQSPQPVANGQGLQNGSGLGLNSSSSSGTNRVGTLFSARA